MTEAIPPAAAVDAIAELAHAAAGSESLELGQYYVMALGGRVEHIDLTGDKYRDAPKRKSGVTTVRDVPSWLAYWGKHSDEHSEVYADRAGLSITAVLDAHTDVAPRFGEHRVVLRLIHTPAFTAWKGIDRRYLSQTAMAEFLEDHRPDIVTPDAATMLELCQTFQATTKVSFKSSQILKSGQRQLQYVEDTQAAAGHRGDIVIPDQVELAVAVFEGATVADAITARLRYRIDSDGKLSLALLLDRLDDVVAAAFEGVVDAVDGDVAVPVLRGVPA